MMLNASLMHEPIPEEMPEEMEVPNGKP